MPFSHNTRWWLVSLPITGWICFRYLPILLHESEGWLDILAMVGLPLMVWWIVTIVLGLIVHFLKPDDK